MKEKYICLGCSQIQKIMCKRNEFYKNCGHYNNCLSENIKIINAKNGRLIKTILAKIITREVNLNYDRIFF